MPIYNMSHGILDGFFTRVTAEQALADEWPATPGDEEIDRVAKEYLAEEYPENYPKAIGYKDDALTRGEIG